MPTVMTGKCSMTSTNIGPSSTSGSAICVLSCRRHGKPASASRYGHGESGGQVFDSLCNKWNQKPVPLILLNLTPQIFSFFCVLCCRTYFFIIFVGSRKWWGIGKRNPHRHSRADGGGSAASFCCQTIKLNNSQKFFAYFMHAFDDALPLARPGSLQPVGIM